MEINSDRRKLALVDGQQLAWHASPESGVERRMLERVGDEVALATSIVRYGPGSRFPGHVHELGEEFLVLEGTFSDGEGDYPRGTYVRNPPGSGHAPHSSSGCVIFVKLRQMAPDENESVRVFPGQRRWEPAGPAGIEAAMLHAPDRSSVCLLRLADGAELPERATPGGEELLVIEGEAELLETPRVALRPWTWRRSADARQPRLRARTATLLWVKRGHL